MLTEAQKQLLLEAARRAIEAAVRGTHAPEYNIHDRLLSLPGSAFVTLRFNHDLRGCIGYIEPVQPLIETVMDAAGKAAMEDFRFIPLQENELHDITIEISVLSPLRQITDVREIEVGKHGIVIEAKNLRGLLLPQVAVEQHWDRETFVMQTARKAGLPPAIVKHPNTKIFIFTAEVFHENEN
jgi:AmmeMemoRadiSam system protein A